MKTESRVIAASIFMGLFVWFADAVFDYLLFYEGTFAELLFLEVPAHEIYIRVLILLCFTVFGIICARLIKKQHETQNELVSSLRFRGSLVDTIPLPIFFKDYNGIYLGCNESFEKFLGKDSHDIIGKSVYDIAPKEIADKYYEKDLELFNTPGVQVYEYDMVNSAGEKRKVVFHKAAFLDKDGQVGGLIGTILDITEREKAAADKQRLINELQEALDKVKLLSGFIPICASCKKIRNDEGYWGQVEDYIREHSEAEFSHGICPDCAKELYPDYVEK
ncbi:MAG: PAS domain-containing protein [Thermodesulfobacteriota bacterium]